MSRKSIPMDYPEEEAKDRFVAALRGARLAGHVPMKAKPKAQKVAKKSKKEVR